MLTKLPENKKDLRLQKSNKIFFERPKLKQSCHIRLSHAFSSLLTHPKTLGNVENARRNVKWQRALNDENKI